MRILLRSATFCLPHHHRSNRRRFSDCANVHGESTPALVEHAQPNGPNPGTRRALPYPTHFKASWASVLPPIHNHSHVSYAGSEAAIDGRWQAYDRLRMTVGCGTRQTLIARFRAVSHRSRLWWPAARLRLPWDCISLLLKESDDDARWQLGMHAVAGQKI